MRTRSIVMASALSLAAAQACAGVNAGASATSGSGLRAHFVVGAFEDRTVCSAAFEKVRARVEGDARWVGERVQVRLADCAETFREKSVHRGLQDGRPFGNVVLAHPNVRAVLISPKGRDDEWTLCGRLAGYVQDLFGGRAECVRPRGATGD